jgi:hypothetical protein
MLRRLWSLLPAVALAACGGARETEKPAATAGDRLCEAGERLLGDRLGPELSAVVHRYPVVEGAPPAGNEDAPPPAPLACALVYTQVAEESSAEDLPPEEVVDAGMDQLLAVVVPGSDGKPALHSVNPSDKSPGPVMLTLSVQDVLSDGRPTLVVQEDRTSEGQTWRGLRLFTFPGQGSAPREILDEELRVKTPEGLDMVAQWQTASMGEKRAIVVEGAGTKRIYTWDASNNRFQFDEAATAQVNPKPPPAPEQPPAAAAEDVPPAKPAEPPAKKKGGKKKTDEKAAEAPIQIPLP